MEQNMTRQVTGLNNFINEIQDFLTTLDGFPPGTPICDIVTSANTEALATLLTRLANFIESQLIVGDEFGYLAQLERLACILRLFADRVRAITCPDAEECVDILFEVLCVLVEAIAILIGIVIKLIALQTFLADNEDFFDCLVCSLVGEITCFEESVRDLSCLIISLLSCDIEECTPCFVATSGKRVRPVFNKNICDKKNECSCKKH